MEPLKPLLLLLLLWLDRENKDSRSLFNLNDEADGDDKEVMLVVVVALVVCLPDSHDKSAAIVVDRCGSLGRAQRGLSR